MKAKNKLLFVKKQIKLTGTVILSKKLNLGIENKKNMNKKLTGTVISAKKLNLGAKKGKKLCAEKVKKWRKTHWKREI